MTQKIFAITVACAAVLVSWPFGARAYLEWNDFATDFGNGDIIPTFTSPTHGQNVNAGGTLRYAGNQVIKREALGQFDNLTGCEMGISLYKSTTGESAGYFMTGTLSKNASTATCSWNHTMAIPSNLPFSGAAWATVYVMWDITSPPPFGSYSLNMGSVWEHVNVIVLPPAADIKANGSDNPAPINSGSTAQITWCGATATACARANKCMVSPSLGSGNAVSGSKTTPALTTETTYTLICWNGAGIRSDSVTVTVRPPPVCAPATSSIMKEGTVHFTASGGSETGYAWTALTGSPSAWSGGFFDPVFNTVGNGQTVTLRDSTGQTDTCTVDVSPPPVGNLEVQRVDKTLGLLGVSTMAEVIGVRQEPNNPALFEGINAGSYGVRTTDLTGYIKDYGTCPLFPVGGTPCNVSTFPSAPSCNGTWCTVSALGVSAGMVSRIAFRYLLEKLSAVLTANPPSGPAPLSGVDLTATVTTNMSGGKNLTFYCSRSDTGTNITAGYVAKYDNVILSTAYTGLASGAGFPGTVVAGGGFTVAVTPPNILEVGDACSYATANTYAAKVIVEQGSLAAQDWQTITVSSGPPPPPTCTPDPASVAIGAPTKLTASGGDGTYSWNTGGGNPPTGTANPLPNVTYATVGTKTVTVTSAGQTGTCNVDVTSVPLPTGDIRVKRVDQNLDPLPTSLITETTEAKVDGVGQKGNNPADFPGISIGSYTVRATDLGLAYTVEYGRISYLRGTTPEPTVSTYSPASCDGTWCSAGSQSVSADTVTKVVFRYTATAAAPTCTPNPASVAIGAPTKLTASGGDGAYSWDTGGGDPPTSNVNPLSNVTYSSAGPKTVTVTSAGKNGTCQVTVSPLVSAPQCSDGVSNGDPEDTPLDPKWDYCSPSVNPDHDTCDIGCVSPTDNDERNRCTDGIDNDGDGAKDYKTLPSAVPFGIGDPGCSSLEDNSEANPPTFDETLPL